MFVFKRVTSCFNGITNNPLAPPFFYRRRHHSEIKNERYIRTNKKITILPCTIRSLWDSSPMMHCSGSSANENLVIGARRDILPVQLVNKELPWMPLPDARVARTTQAATPNATLGSNGVLVAVLVTEAMGEQLL